MAVVAVATKTKVVLPVVALAVVAAHTPIACFWRLKLAARKLSL